VRMERIIVATISSMRVKPLWNCGARLGGPCLGVDGHFCTRTVILLV
jgi:hypothetical protein